MLWRRQLKSSELFLTTLISHFSISKNQITIREKLSRVIYVYLNIFFLPVTLGLSYYTAVINSETKRSRIVFDFAIFCKTEIRGGAVACVKWNSFTLINSYHRRFNEKISGGMSSSFSI